MANVIGIMGESGHGKTASMRNLDPSKTFYIDADGKGLSFKGWKRKYCFANKNYTATSNITTINTILNEVNKKLTHIEVVVIDTVNAVMLDHEIKMIKVKGYDKWIDLASYVYTLIRDSHRLRDDLFVIFLFHVQIESDDTGNKTASILTNGRKLNKIKLETKITNLFYAKCIDGRYLFETQSRNSTAKSMMGLFDQIEIDNDVSLIINKIKHYEKGE
jgi:hypothetical protein